MASQPVILFSWGTLEGEWHILNSVEEASNLLQEYKTNSITKAFLLQ